MRCVIGLPISCRIGRRNKVSADACRIAYIPDSAEVQQLTVSCSSCVGSAIRGELPRRSYSGDGLRHLPKWHPCVDILNVVLEVVPVLHPRLGDQVPAQSFQLGPIPVRGLAHCSAELLCVVLHVLLSVAKKFPLAHSDGNLLNLP